MTMSYNDLDRCIDEARRFIDKAKKAQRRLINDKVDKNWGPICGTKETGAARRASLDLTRILAELRRYS